MSVLIAIATGLLMIPVIIFYVPFKALVDFIAWVIMKIGPM